jgi:hypothetical protein
MFDSGTLPGVNTLDVVLLLALPASGKSEIRRYLASLPPETMRSDFGLAPTVQIDDFPYVHLMRRISQESRRLGLGASFFAHDDDPFLDARDWGTLTLLLNEDYQALHVGRTVDDPSAWLLDRLDRARTANGAPTLFEGIARRALIEEAIADEARDLVATLPSGPIEPDHTVVIEFARGGPVGSSMPLHAPHGYGYALSLLSPEILSRAVILYVWVTPEESRRKNRERARPGDDGSILHHGVPDDVMRAEYGVDDIAWLLDVSEVAGTVTVRAQGAAYHLPVARFDNRVDHTSFLRAEESGWPSGDIDVLHHQLVDVFRLLRERTNSTT